VGGINSHFIILLFVGYEQMKHSLLFHDLASSSKFLYESIMGSEKINFF